MDTTRQQGGIPQPIARILARHFLECECTSIVNLVEVATVATDTDLVIEVAYETVERIRGYVRFVLDADGECTAYEGADEVELIEVVEDEPELDCGSCGGSGGGPDAELTCRVCRGTGLEAA